MTSGLREPVLGLVVELHRHDRARLGGKLGEHVDLETAHKTAGAQVPVEANVGVGSLEAPSELCARAKIREPADDAQGLGDGARVGGSSRGCR